MHMHIHTRRRQEDAAAKKKLEEEEKARLDVSSVDVSVCGVGIHRSVDPA